MVAQRFHCDESRLRAFLEDDMPELDHAELTEHLDACPACRRSLERLAAGSRFWADLKQLAHAPSSPGRPGADAGDTGLFPPAHAHGATSNRDHSLAFLAPSEVAGSVGRLGPYEVTDVLGRGGFGVVLKAHDPALGRAVAIKVLAPQLATSGSARSRFAREARAAAAVVHDHVVAIHAVDSWNGLPYLVMPYVAGQSLQERVDRDGPLGAKEVLRIGSQTALGLAAAHAQGLVHRDVKPSNILLENGVERVRLTDFGLARAVDDGSLTQSGVVAGTPQYMSPEQAAGSAVDHRSDLFSLGSVLYFMCVGHPPFRASSTPAILRRLCDFQPRPIRELNPDIPDWLTAIVDRLHAKDPAARFQSAVEVADTLSRYLAQLQRGLPITTPRAAASAPKQESSGPKTWIAGAVAVPAIVVALVAFGRSKQTGGDLPIAESVSAQTADGRPSFIGKDRVIQITEQDSSDQPVVGSGVAASKSWDVAGFTKVQIRSAFHADIAKGPSFKVTTTADDNVLDKVQVIKDGTTLKISLAKGNYNVTTPLKAAITLPTLAGAAVSGASKVTLKGFESEKDVSFNVSGASSIEGAIGAEQLELEASGASWLALKGAARAGRLTASGASHLRFAELLLQQGEVQLTGGSDAAISVQSGAPFKASLADASELSGSIKATDIKLDLTGASTARLHGTANSAKLKAEFASTLRLADFAIDNALVTLEGASTAAVDVKTTLNYDLSGASSLRYRGATSTLKGTKSGASSVSQMR